MTTAMFKTGMNRSLLTNDFFQSILDRAHGPNTTKALTWSEQELDSSASILSNISSGDDDEDDNFEDEDEDSGLDDKQNVDAAKVDEPCPMNDMTGHFLYKIQYKNIHSTTQEDIHPSNHSHRAHLAIESTSRSSSSSLSSTTSRDTHQDTDDQLWVVIKSKPIDTALIELTNIMAQLQGGSFADEYDLVKDLTGFRNSHIREIELAELTWQSGGAIERVSTKVYNVLRNDYQQLYALCLEYLDPNQSGGAISHMNSTETALTTWSADDIHLVLKDLASLHAQFLGQESRLLGMSFLENPTRSLMKVLRPAYEAMIRTNRKNQPELFSEYLTQAMLEYLEHSDKFWATIESSPRTLIHGDFNTRNICLRRDLTTGAKQLCAYDWELACCQVPQRDVVEFLAFVLPPDSPEWPHYIEYHRLALKASFESYLSSSTSSSPTVTAIPSSRAYLEVAKLALMDFASLRVAMYGISNSFKQVEWLPRIVASVEAQVRRLGPLRASPEKVLVQSKF
ncbi:hypothetical protein BGZ94_007415 [Podila epigama]|nr:hypothetical protein BGZ94_007415 [Podila epigama]